MTNDQRTLDEIGKRLQGIADAEDGPKETGGIFGTKPIRWWEKPHWRCVNDHVSTWLLGTDEGRVCMACNGHVWLTFPEDAGGPLVTPVRKRIKGRLYSRRM